MCLRDGWNGAQGKRLGWPLSSFKKEWANIKTLKLYFIDIWRHFQAQRVLLKWLSLNSEIDKRKQQGKYSKGQLFNSELKQ